MPGSVSAMSPSLVQRSPTDCGAPLCVNSRMRMPWLALSHGAAGKKYIQRIFVHILKFILVRALINNSHNKTNKCTNVKITFLHTIIRNSDTFRPILITFREFLSVNKKVKVKVSRDRPFEVVLGVPGSLRPRIFSTFGTTSVVGRQPNAPAAFTPGEIPGTHFQNLSRPQGTWFCRKEPRKKSQVTPSGIDPGTVRLVAQRLNATPGPQRK